MGINATRLFSVMYHCTLNVGRVVSPILIHKAAKKAFDAFGLEKLPTVRSLNEEFARLLAEKKAAYAEYHRAQERMRELLIHKANAACLLGPDEQNRQTTERQREEK